MLSRRAGPALADRDGVGVRTHGQFVAAVGGARRPRRRRGALARFGATFVGDGTVTSHTTFDVVPLARPPPRRRRPRSSPSSRPRIDRVAAADDVTGLAATVRASLDPMASIVAGSTAGCDGVDLDPATDLPTRVPVGPASPTRCSPSCRPSGPSWSLPGIDVFATNRVRLVEVNEAWIAAFLRRRQPRVGARGAVERVSRPTSAPRPSRTSGHASPPTHRPRPRHARLAARDDGARRPCRRRGLVHGAARARRRDPPLPRHRVHARHARPPTARWSTTTATCHPSARRGRRSPAISIPRRFRRLRRRPGSRCGTRACTSGSSSRSPGPLFGLDTAATAATDYGERAAVVARPVVGPHGCVRGDAGRAHAHVRFADGAWLDSARSADLEWPRNSAHLAGHHVPAAVPPAAAGRLPDAEESS